MRCECSDGYAIEYVVCKLILSKLIWVELMLSLHGREELTTDFHFGRSVTAKQDVSDPCFTTGASSYPG